MKKEILNEIWSANKNLIINGTISTGKTKNIGLPLVGKFIEEKESFFVLDSKEEYVKKYYNKTKEKGYNTIIINLRDLDQSEGWNLLEYPYDLYKKGETDKTLKYLEQIGNELFYEGGTADPFWAITAADFFTGVTFGLYEDAKREEINISSVNRVFNAVDMKYANSTYVTQYFKLKDPSSIAYTCASATVFAPPATRASILSVAKQKLRSLVTREMLSKLLSKTTFDYNEITKKPTAIFFIAKDEETYLNSLVSMFISQLYSILIDNKVSGKFNIVLDNFDSIPNVNELVDMLSSCISRNIKFSIITRSKEQLEKKYGKYINNLSNNINVDDTNIEININGKSKNIENIFTTEEEVSNVEYPKMTNTEVNVFDIIDFVNKKNKEFKQEVNNSKKDNIIELDDFIGEINDEIEKLEQEKKEKQQKKDNLN